MKTVGNILWIVFAGFWTAIGWLILGGFFAITVVGLPFARQCLKLARLTFWPFGRTVVKSPNASTLGPVGNVLWFIPGLFMAVCYVIGGLLLFISIIGIPFGVQSFKFAQLSLAPFGKEIVRARDVTTALGKSQG